MTSRADRRRLPKREWKRRCRHDITRILELGAKGVSPQAIASSLNLSDEFVRLVLEETIEKEAGNAESSA